MKYILLLIPFLLVQPVLAQSKLPIIRAASKTVSIRDGDFLDKNMWSLSPKLRPDIYTADRARKTKWVTFYTDIDSIRVKVKPGTRFNFVVLFGKDSCYTQIASSFPPKNASSKELLTEDTIPFELTSYNTIKVRTVVNDTDTLNFHFDVSSFGFCLTKDFLSKNNRKVAKLQMGTMVWNKPIIRTTTATAHDMDGRFGWDLFEGKKVEIDYDNHLLIIHSRLPKTLKGYARSKIEFIRSFPCVKGAFKIAGKKYPCNFLLDTGSDQAALIDSAWDSKLGFPTRDLQLIKTSVIRDARGIKYNTRVVLSPILNIDRFGLSNVPTYVMGSNPAGFEVNFLGNDLLKRFNIILDFKNDYLYLKPNKLMDSPYRQAS
jgi:hypothetical protein